MSQEVIVPPGPRPTGHDTNAVISPTMVGLADQVALACWATEDSSDCVAV